MTKMVVMKMMDPPLTGQALMGLPRPALSLCTFGDMLYCTRDIPEEKGILKKLVAPTVHKPAPKRATQAAAKPAAATSSIPDTDGEHLQHFKTPWGRNRKFYTVPTSSVIL